MLPDDMNLDDPSAHALPIKKEKVISPLHNKTEVLSDESAVNLIREKLKNIYNDEPDAQKELEEENQHHGRRSKHQQYMHELSGSGKPLAEIQTAWHEYYTNLPDEEKHIVWQEFYSNYNKTTQRKPQVQRAEPRHAPAPEPSPLPAYRKTDRRSPSAIKQELRERVQKRIPKPAKNHHVASIKFGLLSGVLVLIVMMFGFFNERLLVPFIRPSHSISATPLIIDENGSIGPEPKLIIPKINVEVPIVYDEPSIAENAVQTALERGVLHYATTPDPGEFGNAVVFGHSSNNIFNSGNYKYVFVQLNKLEVGDTFFVHKDGVRYVYKIYEKKIVSPREVSVLNTTEKDATMTLITCDPPGTAINRLVVIGEQISPSKDSNEQSSVSTEASREPEILPSNAPSLWSRLTGWL